MPGWATRIVVNEPGDHFSLGDRLADATIRLPDASDPRYLPALRHACVAESIDVLLPVYDGELATIAANRAEIEADGTRVLLPPEDVVQRCRDKAETYRHLGDSDLIPSYSVARTLEETRAALSALGYPNRVLVARPLDRAGSRGVQYIDPAADLFASRFLEKPGPVRVCAAEFLRGREAGPREFALLITPCLDGEELGIDLLAERGRVVEMVVRRKSGPLLHGNPTCIAFREQPGEREWVARLAAGLQLCGLVSIDARYDAGGALRLLEVNPRPGAYIGMSCARLHLLGWAIDRLLGDASSTADRYGGDWRIFAGLRAFGDLVLSADTARPLPLRSPRSEELSDARPVPCGAPG